MARIARLLLLASLLLPTLIRRLPELPRAPCEPAGRGDAPRHWLGCAADGGARRDLSGEERLVLGLPLDPNRATARELAFVPGLTPSLAAEVVAERGRGGPFQATEELLRVHGIGPVRLARVSPFLAVEGARVGVADGVE